MFAKARVLPGCFLALLLGGCLLPQARAAEVKFNLDTTRLVLAEEINLAQFGDEHVFGANNPPTVILTFTSGIFRTPDFGRIVYRLLDGAEFGANLRSPVLNPPGSWTLSSMSESFAIDIDIFSSDVGRGMSGQSSVRVNVSRAGGTDNVAGIRLTLNLPGLQNLHELQGGDQVRVQIQIDDMFHENSNGDGNFPDVDPLTHGERGHTITDDVLVEVVDAVQLSATSASTRSVQASENTPARFPSSAATVSITDANGNPRQGIDLGSLRLLLHADAQQADGTPFALTADDTLTISITATEGFGVNTIAFIDLDGDLMAAPDELIELPAAELVLAGDAAAVSALASAERRVYLAPDGGANIRTSDYSLGMALVYGDAGYLAEEPVATAAVSVTGVAVSVDRDAEFQLETSSLGLALEFFGPGSSPVAIGGTHLITLRVRSNSGVSRGATALITYELENGLQFGGRNLASGDLQLSRNNSLSEAAASLMSGGQLGASRALFMVTTGTASGDEAALAEGDALVLTLPGIRITRTGRAENDRFEVTVSIAPGTTSGDFNFPRLNPLTQGEDGSLIESDVLVRLGRQFTLQSEASVLMPTLALDARTRLVSGALSVGLPDGGTGQAVHLGGLGVTRAEPAYKGEDGGTDFALAEDDRFLVTLSGNELPAGLSAFIDLDGDTTLDTGEAVSPTDGLSLSGTGDGAAALLAESRSVYLVTDGEAMLELGNYAANLALDFANADYLNPAGATATVAITLEGVLQQGFAYAIPNCTQVERGSVHLVNETERPLTLFVQGRDQAGANLGLVQLDASLVRGSGRPELQPGEALDLLTEQVEQLFNLNDGGFGRGNRCTREDTWHGRAQLRFLSDGNLTVLPQLRGSRGELRDIGGFSGLSLGDGEAVIK